MKRITRYLFGNHSVGWRAAWEIDDNRALIIAGIVWLIFAGFSVYGIVCFVRNLV